MDEAPKRKGPPPRNKMTQPVSRQLRSQQMVEMAMRGKSVKEISEELNTSRTSVYRALSSEEVKQIIREGDNRIHQLVHRAIDTVEHALEGDQTDMTNAVKAALTVLKSVGVIKDKVEMQHTMPVPVIIRRRNGEEVELGSALPEEKAS